jgi:hypothetical protein
MTSGWVTNLRTVLELAFFASNIVIAVAVVLGLKQISLAKKIATSDAKRESLKFAAERCQYFADTCVTLQDKVSVEHRRLALTFLTKRLKFSIVNGEIVVEDFAQAARLALQVEFQKMPIDIVKCLNSLEAFAIPFASNVADDEVGFQETAATFCETADRLIGFVVLLRATGVRYESTMRLYDRWKSRLVAQNLEGKMKELQEQHKAAAAKGQVKPTNPF